MNNIEHVPLILDWGFWAAVIAALALILSQLPPLKVLIRPTRLRLDPYDRLNIMHWLGTPSVILQLALTNTGGREVSVLSIDLTIHPEDGSAILLPALSFFVPGSTQSASFLFTRFSLKPDDTWSNFVNF